MRTKIFFLIFFLKGILVHANNVDTIKSSIQNSFELQVQHFPQEKVHLHIDKPLYLSGERVWAKAHVVYAATHKPVKASAYVYMELIDENKTVIKRIKTRRIDGYSSYIDLPENLPEGNYYIRAYTYYMNNMDSEYLTTVPIEVKDPKTADINIIPLFDFSNKKKTVVQLDIVQTLSGEKYKPVSLNITLDGNVIDHKMTEDGTVYFNIKQNGEIQTILVECDKQRKNITIPPSATDYELAFYPEGGNIIENARNQIAFKAINANGEFIEVKGVVIDNEGNDIVEFESLHDGMGVFFIDAGENKSYTAICNYGGVEKIFDLPKALFTEGITAKWLDKQLSISANFPKNQDQAEPSYLIIHSRGILQYINKWNRSKNELLLDASEFPSGVLHILLINYRKEIVSERLVFCINDDQATVVSKDAKTNFDTRSHIPIELKIQDLGQQPLSASGLSVSVVDNKDVNPYMTPSILSSLLLTSELKGYINNPNYYFDSKNENRKEALDLLMLTHGWRRYNVPNVIKGEIEEPQISLEIGQVISGQVVSTVKNKPIADAQVSILALNNTYSNITQTDKNGMFYFQGFESPENTKFILRALSKDGSEHVKLLVDDDNIYPDPTSISFKTEKDSLDYNTISYINKAEQKYVQENGIRMIYLNTVEVVGKRLEPFKTPYSAVADKRYNEEYFKEKNITNISEALRTEAGLIVDDTDVFGRSGKPFAVFIDGVYFERPGDVESGGTLSRASMGYYDKLARGSLNDLVPFNMIESIEVFKSAASVAIFGYKGGAGVIMINTKKGVFTPIESNALNLHSICPLGYQLPLEFYSSKYETEEQRNSKVRDLKTTIYWSPNLSADADGNISFDFFSADSKSNYTITLEGVTDNGKLIHYQTDLNIE